MILRLLLFLAALVFGGCSGSKPGPAEAAADFFVKCDAGQIEAAYKASSQIFQLERTQKYFEARVRDLGLDKVKSVEWSAPEKRGETQRVKGEFTLEDGSTLPLLVTMAEESGHWRVLHAKRLDGQQDDVFAVVSRSQDTEGDRNKALLEPVAMAMPSDRQLQQLVEDTLMSFNDALQRGDFDDFFTSVSDRWKYRGKDPRALNYSGNDPARLREADPHNTSQRLTVAALRRAFQPFMDVKIDLSPLKGKKMVLDEPAHITSDAVLTLKGHYKEFVFQAGFPPQPRRLTFKLEYVFEGSSWRLFGITVNVVPPDSVNNGR